MRLLNYQEQSAQIQWLQYKQKEYELILKLASNDRVARNAQFQLFKKEKEQVFSKAGKLWLKNFGESRCEQVTTLVKRSIDVVGNVVSGLSPKRRRRERV